MDNSIKSRSWFCVWNNPQETVSGTPEEIAENVLQIWVDDKPTRAGAVAFCISADGLKHLHMVLEDSAQVRFSALKKLYPKAHLEPTRGNKEQAEDYIHKKGKFEEKGEQVLYIAQYGKIKGSQGQRKDFEVLEYLIEQGKTPVEIMDMSFSYRRYEKYIRDAYFRKRARDTPFLREIKVYWHVGKSGSGKSYSCLELAKEKGEDNIYLVNDYDNGFLDGYNGQPVLFLDEFRGQIRFSTLLSMLQGYKQTFHARYTNVLGLWNEVHITSVLPPEMVYRRMVSENREIDNYEQLKRRLTAIVYHYMENGLYQKKEIPIEKYISYRVLTDKQEGDGFITVTEYEQMNFEQLEVPFD